jgi:hypothetical protein
VSEEAKRIEAIRERTEAMEANRSLEVAAGHVVNDLSYLLKRVEELEAERDKYEFWYETTKKSLVEAEDRVEELVKENDQRQALIDDCFTKSREKRQRIEELEEKYKGMSISETHHATLLSDCEMENQRLRSQLEKRNEVIAEIQRGGGW